MHHQQAHLQHTAPPCSAAPTPGAPHAPRPCLLQRPRPPRPGRQAAALPTAAALVVKMCAGRAGMGQWFPGKQQLQPLSRSRFLGCLWADRPMVGLRQQRQPADCQSGVAIGWSGKGPGRVCDGPWALLHLHQRLMVLLLLLQQ
eukprot:scaffold149660_cov20-Tisochrysis_lutea.AAC.1